MKALILAAGYGTRLKEIAKDTPKALLDIQGKPILWYILDKIKDLNGLNEVLIVTNNKFYPIFDQWAQSIGYAHPIRVINDGTNTPEERLGSIGDINYALKEVSVQEDVLVIGSDNLFDYDLKPYIIGAQKKSESVTIGLFDIGSLEEAKRFGVVALDDQQKIISFVEKPTNPQSSLIAMCLYYIPKATLHLVNQYLTQVKISDTAGDYIRWLCEQTTVYGFTFTGKWYDIGSIESYKDAQDNY